MTHDETTQSTHRRPSRLDMACEAYVHDMAALVPTAATALGISDYDDQLQNFTPAFFEDVADRQKTFLAEVQNLEDEGTKHPELAFDDIDRVTAKVVRNRIGLELEMHEAHEDIRELNNLESPVQQIRDSFILMPRESQADRDKILGRLDKIPDALQGYTESLTAAAAMGLVAAKRQINIVIDQCRAAAGEKSPLKDVGVDPEATEVSAAQYAYGKLADWLQDNLLPQGSDSDFFGRDRYEMLSRQFVGVAVDLDEAHEWGKKQLARIVDEQRVIAQELYGPGVTVEEALKRLDTDERYTLHGVDALQKWMQKTADQAISDLGGTHFAIPPAIQTIECLIDPSGTGGIFYTPPSDDFARPGRMWWSVPKGEDTFHTWQELTTVYHEGVPGHHLQCGQTLVERDNLNLWRRADCWNSGHGEGWALYAEQLMVELGYHDDPGTKMGVLDAQRLRAARVVLDTGVHLNKKTDEGGTWDYDYAYTFLRNNVAMAEPNLLFELNRYLGWAGQAPSYALGQRLWLQLRDEAMAAGMTLPEFHQKALSLGSIPMDILRDEVLR